MTATGLDDARRETGESNTCPVSGTGIWNYILEANYNKEGETGALDLTKYSPAAQPQKRLRLL